MSNHQRRISNPNAKTQLIIVMGVSGSGKSTLAESLAREYGFIYLDGDDFHSEEARARMAQGLPLDDEMRKPWVETICQYLNEAKNGRDHYVLAFSGLRKAHRQAVRDTGLKTLTLFLNGSETTIQERVNRRTDHFMDPSLVRSQFASLEDPSGEPDVHMIDVSTDLLSVIEQAKRVVAQELQEPAI